MQRPWRATALVLLGAFALGAVGVISYTVGVDHGTTIEVADGEAFRTWRHHGWGHGWGHGYGFFPLFPFLLGLFLLFLLMTLVRAAIGPRQHGFGPHGFGPPWATQHDAPEDRFDAWHRRSHDRIGRSPARDAEGVRDHNDGGDPPAAP